VCIVKHPDDPCDQISHECALPLPCQLKSVYMALTIGQTSTKLEFSGSFPCPVVLMPYLTLAHPQL